MENDSIMPSKGPESKQVLESRGKRLRMVRSFIYPVRADFSSAIGASDTSVKIWESGTGYGLRPKSAKKSIDHLKLKGVSVSIEWLMDGEGPAPCAISIPADKTIEAISLDEHIHAFELSLRAHFSGEVLVYRCKDNSMNPRFSNNDLVGGKAVDINEINLLLNKPCIVQFKDKTVFRKVAQQSETELALFCSNPDDSIGNPVIVAETVKIIAIAPVILHIDASALNT